MVWRGAAKIEQLKRALFRDGGTLDGLEEILGRNEV
mgnify:CR=1 FL=1